LSSDGFWWRARGDPQLFEDQPNRAPIVGGSRIMEARAQATPGFRESRPYLRLRALGRIVRDCASVPRRLLSGEIAKFRRNTRRKPAIEVDAAVDIPYPEIDLDAYLDPLPVIAQAPELARANAFFAHSSSATRSLVSAVEQAMIYSLVRNLCPAHVFEIGTYLAGTAEAICRGLYANGQGILHTTDPFGGDRVPPVLACWPSELREHIRFYCSTSMEFFSRMIDAADVRPALVFIDGNHDFEYAAFDIGCAARLLQPSGFILVDNVSQAGPFWAARDFLMAHPDWPECRVTERARDPSKAFDAQRSNIPDTDLMVLRAPPKRSVGERPVTFGEVPLHATGFDGIAVPLGNSAGDGILHVQCVLRGFSQTAHVEKVGATSCRVSSRDAGEVLQLPLAMDLGTGFEVVRLEIWLIWTGARPLLLEAAPVHLLSDASAPSQSGQQ
jgi:Methyltransferase domain